MRIFLTLIFIVLGSLTARGQQTDAGQAVLHTLDSFHQAIVENDTEGARAVLADAARILEGGNVETREEYLSHHFHSDGEFLSAMNREIDEQTVRVNGEVAWVSTQTHTYGTLGERELDLTTLELAVLQKEGDRWKITALHWSSAGRN